MVAEFAGVASAMEIFGVTRYIAVPLAGLLVWVLVLRGTYRQVEKVFLALCTFYLTYLFSAILAQPDWLDAARHTRHSFGAIQRELSADADGAGGHDHRARGNSFTCRRDLWRNEWGRGSIRRRARM